MGEVQINESSWRELPDMPVKKWESATFVLDDKLYVLGGYTADVKTCKDCHIFDPADRSWTEIQELPSAISHINPVLDGRVAWYAGGFKDGYKDHVVAEVWNYDIDNDGPIQKGRYTAGPLLPEKRGGGGLARIGRKLHFISGLKEDRDTDAEDHWVMDLDEYADTAQSVLHRGPQRQDLSDRRPVPPRQLPARSAQCRYLRSGERLMEQGPGSAPWTFAFRGRHLCP